MIIKQAENTRCTKCGQVCTHQPEVNGCDTCKKVFKQSDTYLEVATFHNERVTEQYRFCCWKCVAKFIKKVKVDFFISLPYIQGDAPVGQRIDEFLKILK